MQIQTHVTLIWLAGKGQQPKVESLAVCLLIKNEYETISVYHACTTAMSHILQFTFSQKQKCK